MDTNLGANDPYFAQQAVSLLYNWSESDRINHVSDLVESFLGGPCQLEDYPEQGGFPRIGLAAANGVSLFMILGATTPATVANCVYGWQEPRHLRSQFGIVTTFEIGARAIISLYGNFPAVIQNRCIILGYSAGGAIGQALGAILSTQSATSVVSVITFGQPKMGDDRIVQACSRMDYHAWWNEGDNIRFCPPNNREARTLHLLLTREQNLAVNQLNQLGLATRISEDCVLSPEPATNEGGPFTDLSIANFLRTNDAPTAQAHSLAEYNRRLGLWTTRNPPAPIRPRAQSNITAPRPANVQNVMQPLPAVLPLKPTSADIPVRPVAVSEYEPPYYTFKNGKIWTVLYQGNTVYVAPTKTEAKRFASRMNSAYLLWFRAKAFDGPAFAESVDNLFQS